MSLFQSPVSRPRHHGSPSTVDEKDLHRLLDGIERMKAQHAEHEQQYSLDLTEARASKAALSRRCSELQEGLDELTHELEAQQRSNEREKERNEDFLEKISKLEERAEIQARITAQVEFEREALRAQVESLESQIKDLNASKSDTESCLRDLKLSSEEASCRQQMEIARLKESNTQLQASHEKALMEMQEANLKQAQVQQKRATEDAWQQRLLAEQLDISSQQFAQEMKELRHELARVREEHRESDKERLQELVQTNKKLAQAGDRVDEISTQMAQARRGLSRIAAALVPSSNTALRSLHSEEADLKELTTELEETAQALAAGHDRLSKQVTQLRVELVQGKEEREILSSDLAIVRRSREELLQEKQQHLLALSESQARLAEENAERAVVARRLHLAQEEVRLHQDFLARTGGWGCAAGSVAAREGVEADDQGGAQGDSVKPKVWERNGPGSSPLSSPLPSRDEKGQGDAAPRSPLLSMWRSGMYDSARRGQGSALGGPSDKFLYGKGLGRVSLLAPSPTSGSGRGGGREGVVFHSEYAGGEHEQPRRDTLRAARHSLANFTTNNGHG